MSFWYPAFPYSLAASLFFGVTPALGGVSPTEEKAAGPAESNAGSGEEG